MNDDQEIDFVVPVGQGVGAHSEHRIPGLGRMTDDDGGFITLQFVDEAAATKFMQNYAPSVDVDDMPSLAAAAVPAPAEWQKLFKEAEESLLHAAEFTQSPHARKAYIRAANALALAAAPADPLAQREGGGE